MQTQEQFADALSTTHQCIYKRLHGIGEIQKVRKWVPHETTDRQMKNRRAASEILLL